jgi:membrane-associated phospholipid phosphatase
MTSSRVGISSRLVTCLTVVVASAVTGSVAGASPGGEPSQKVLAIGVSLATTKPGSSEVARRAAVTQWIELELDAIAAHRTNPARASRALALVSRAMYEAAVAGDASRDAAVAGAASTVLAYLFPDEGGRIHGLAQRAARGSGEAPSAGKGFALGRRIGEALIARARSDGSSAVSNGAPPVGPGYWIPTPPAFVYPPLEPLAGTWRTWNMVSGAQFRPGPPPGFGSPQFLAEAYEVYAVSQSLSEEQKRIADYWADGPGTATPPGHWNLIALDLVREAGWGTVRTARLFAALNTAQADAFIACWDAKYAYWSLRPVTAIRGLIDPSWLPYIATPPFPSYVSGHSTTSGAASRVLAALFPRRAEELAATAEEAAVSRLYGGIHFSSDNEVGLELGRRVGTAAVEAYSLDL